MTRRLFVLVLGCGLVVGIVAAGKHGEPGHESVKPLAAREIAEKMDGRDAMATAVEVTLEAGQSSPAHRHPGPALGYVLEGVYEWGIDDQPSIVLKAGDTFYEPGGCLHRVSKNPGNAKTRILAWVIHPRDAKEIVVPEKR